MSQEFRSPVEGLPVEDILPHVEASVAAALGEHRVGFLARRVASHVADFLAADPDAERRALEERLPDVLEALVIGLWDDPDAKRRLAQVTGHEDLPVFVNRALVCELGMQLFSVLADLALTLWSVGGLAPDAVRHALDRDVAERRLAIH